MGFQYFIHVNHCLPAAVDFALDLHRFVVQILLPVGVCPLLVDALPPIFLGETVQNLFLQNRIIPLPTSIPRSGSKSSTFRSERGKRTYNITAIRIIARDVLK